MSLSNVHKSPKLPDNPTIGELTDNKTPDPKTLARLHGPSFSPDTSVLSTASDRSCMPPAANRKLICVPLATALAGVSMPYSKTV